MTKKTFAEITITGKIQRGKRAEGGYYGFYDLAIKLTDLTEHENSPYLRPLHQGGIWQKPMTNPKLRKVRFSLPRGMPNDVLQALNEGRSGVDVEVHFVGNIVKSIRVFIAGDRCFTLEDPRPFRQKGATPPAAAEKAEPVASPQSAETAPEAAATEAAPAKKRRRAKKPKADAA